jgi:hypothetical protein
MESGAKASSSNCDQLRDQDMDAPQAVNNALYIIKKTISEPG